MLCGLDLKEKEKKRNVEAKIKMERRYVWCECDGENKKSIGNLY